MTSSDADKFSKEVCELKHKAVDSDLEHLKEMCDQGDEDQEKRMDKIEAKFNALVLAILTAIGGILAPVIVDLINKFLSMTGG